MTTTTPTTALADLDLDKLEQQATMFRNIEAFHPGHFRALKIFASSTLDLIALARRAAQPNSPEFGGFAAQPVAPVQANCPYCEKRDGTHDGAFPHPRLVPSPQIAEVAELPPLPEPLAHDPDKHDAKLPIQISAERLARILRRYARDAIAASSRAAGGDMLERAAKLAIKFTAVPRDLLGPATPQMKATAAVGEKLATAIRALANPAPAPALASAGQAAPALPRDLTDAEIVEVLASLGTDAEPSKYDWNPVLQVRTTVPAIRQIITAYLKYAAQPAEGAGQAGQVAKEPMDFDSFFEVVRASERAATPASGDISQSAPTSAPVADAAQGEKAAAANAGGLRAIDWTKGIIHKDGITYAALKDGAQVKP